MHAEHDTDLAARLEARRRAARAAEDRLEVARSRLLSARQRTRDAAEAAEALRLVRR